MTIALSLLALFRFASKVTWMLDTVESPFDQRDSWKGLAHWAALCRILRDTGWQGPGTISQTKRLLFQVRESQGVCASVVRNTPSYVSVCPTQRTAILVRGRIL